MKILLSVAIKYHSKIILQEVSFCFENVAAPYGIPKSSLNQLREVKRHELKNQIDTHVEISHTGTKSVFITRTALYFFVKSVHDTKDKPKSN